jgi:hypothetical protein
MGALVWLASYPKSGNTWVRAFLHNLVHDRGGALDLNALPSSVKSDADRADFERLASRPLEDLGHAGIAALRAPVQRAIARAATGAVLIKTHSALTMVGGHASHAVDVTRGAVYLVRDPRDVAVSYADHLGIGVDRAIDILATSHAHTVMSPRHVTEFPGSWTQNVATWTTEGNERVHVARYEDLLTDPEARFAAIAAFLGIESEPETFRRALANTAFRELSRQERQSGFIERSHRQQRFFRKGRAGDWRQVLTAGQAARIVADHGEQMARFDYGDG